MKFYEKLQKLRKEKGMSQENLADILNVSRQAVSKWESGQSFPETDKLIILSNMFGVTIDSLLKEGELEAEVNTSGNSTQAYTVPLYGMRGYSYEYKSEKTLWGLPLVHVNFGWGRKAKGVIAIGLASKGVVSIGLASVGLISFGLVSLGLIGLGCLSVGLLLSAGALAIGTMSFGAVAVGALTYGAVSVGMVSLGALAVGSHIAIGDYAVGHIAIGRTAIGEKIIEVADSGRIFADVSKVQVKMLINSEFPNMWDWVVRLVTMWFR